MNTTRIEGISWTTHSRNDRSCSIAGRHFFATRCAGSSGLWSVEELSQADPAGAQALRGWGGDLETAELSGFVYDILMTEEAPVGLPPVGSQGEYTEAQLARVESPLIPWAHQLGRVKRTEPQP